MTPIEKSLVQESWRQVAPIADSAAAMFYSRLFEVSPEIQGLFTDVDLRRQGRRLTQVLTSIIEDLDAIETRLPDLAALGRRHADYGVTDAHYATVGEALLWTLQRGLGGAWTEEVADAWAVAYGLVAGVMQSATPARQTNTVAAPL